MGRDKRYATNQSQKDNYDLSLRNVTQHIIDADPDVLILQEIGGQKELFDIFEMLNGNKRDGRETKNIT